MTDNEQATASSPQIADAAAGLETEACDRVRSFLNAMERRDLESARSHLSRQFQMTFPGDEQFKELEELVEWGKKRYRSVSKTYHQFDVSHSGDTAVVYCFGTLSGELPNGRFFEGIRFIDRFTVKGNLLQDQKVWNDMGEVLGSV